MIKKKIKIQQFVTLYGKVHTHLGVIISQTRNKNQIFRKTEVWYLRQNIYFLFKASHTLIQSFILNKGIFLDFIPVPEINHSAQSIPYSFGVPLCVKYSPLVFSYERRKIHTTAARENILTIIGFVFGLSLCFSHGYFKIVVNKGLNKI